MKLVRISHMSDYLSSLMDTLDRWEEE
jgi:hypothetical protein